MTENQNWAIMIAIWILCGIIVLGDLRDRVDEFLISVQLVLLLTQCYGLYKVISDNDE